MKSNKKRFFRKSVAIFVGLLLGWIAADVAFDQVPAAVAYSEAPKAGAAAHAKGHHEGPMHSIEALKPVGGKGPWYGKVIRAAVLLFFAAVALGPVAMSLKSPEPPERDDSHGRDAHDSHASHDSHGAPAAHGAHAAPSHGGHGH